MRKNLSILVVEDFAARQEIFKDKLVHFHLDIVDNADDGILMLEGKNYDIVFLDHDLKTAKSGTYLTLEWYQNKSSFITQKPLVIIHSMNMEGATQMEKNLNSVSAKTIRTPFKHILLGQVNVSKLIYENLC